MSEGMKGRPLAEVIVEMEREMRKWSERRVEAVAHYLAVSNRIIRPNQSLDAINDPAQKEALRELADGYLQVIEASDENVYNGKWLDERIGPDLLLPPRKDAG